MDTPPPDHPLKHHYWGPIDQVVRLVESMTAGMSNVLEIGPGDLPFSPATEFVDWRTWPKLEGKRVHSLDLNQDALPMADRSIDFVYCRHTLEDLYNPFLVCREMSRVARGGYIETPSPIAECTRGVDYDWLPWRGYHHHRYLVWVENDTLMFLPKYAVLEHISFGESQLADWLNAHPLYWNTYFFWEGELRYRLLEHDKDYKITIDYPQRVLDAIRQSHEQTRIMAERLGLTNSAQ